MSANVLKRDSFRSEDELILDIAKIISKRSGNVLESDQLTMMQSRLKKRFHLLKLDSIQEYYDYFLQSPESRSFRIS